MWLLFSSPFLMDLLSCIDQQVLHHLHLLLKHSILTARPSLTKFIIFLLKIGSKFLRGSMFSGNFRSKIKLFSSMEPLSLMFQGNHQKIINCLSMVSRQVNSNFLYTSEIQLPTSSLHSKWYLFTHIQNLVINPADPQK